MLREANLVLVVLFFLFSCDKKREYTKEEFIQHIKDPSSGMIKMNEINNISIKVSYRPYQLVAASMSSVRSKDSVINDSSCKFPYRYFILSISQNGTELLGNFNGREQFSELLNKLAFNMRDYVSVTTSNNDTIYVADYAMPRTFGLSPTTDIQFAFKSEKLFASDWMEINVKDVGLDIGTQKIRFDISDLKKIDNIVLIK